MAITTHTVTGNLADLLGEAYKQVRVTVKTNLDIDAPLVDQANNTVLLGHGSIMVTSDGILTIEGLIDPASADVNATGLQYQFILEYPQKGVAKVTTLTLGWFSITADADLADLVGEQQVPPNYLSAAIEQLEGIRDDVIDLSNIGTPDSLVEALVKNTGGAGPLTSGALSASYVGITEFDLRSFLNEGETFPDDGVLNASTLINRAVSAIAALVWADSTDRVFTLNLGPGRFRLNSAINVIAGKTYAKRIKIRGDARWRTILLPYGTTTPFTTSGAAVTSSTPLDFFWFDNCHFEDFTIDARNTGYPEVAGLQKAFQAGGWKECTWNRVTAIGTTATMFGTDYPVRCVYTDCWSIGAGRGTTQETVPANAAEMRSGFGIGFGHYDDESVTFIGGGATGAARSGYFFERQDSRSTLRREAIIRLIGVEASRNGNGITDAGCCGVDMVDCKVTDNVAAGFYNGPNTQAVASGINGRIKGSRFLRNGVGAFFTGSIQPTPADAPVGAGGGYVIESSRFEANIGAGVQAKNFLLEAGGMTIKGNQFVRNGGYGIDMRRASSPLRDLTVDGNDFDGNTGCGLALLVPMNAPRITDNDFFNSDGTARQTDAIMVHPAEPVTVPRIQRNTWRQHTRGLVNTSRLDQALISSNLDVTSAYDPATAGLYDENLQSKPDASASTLGAGWSESPAGASTTWLRTSGGTRPTTGTWGAHAIQIRDFGTSGLYLSTTIPDSSQGAGKNRFRGVALGGSSTEAIMAGVDDLSSQLGAPQFYAMWKVIAGTPTLLWTSTVPATEGHSVALGREAGSTMTTMFIDGIAVHTEDIPDVPSSNYGGVAAASGVAGTSGSTPCTRQCRWFRAVATQTPLAQKTGTVRNKATNPSFELTGGFTSQAGTGGVVTASRASDAPNAHSGTYSYLLTWTTATTDPVGGGGRIAAIEDVTVGKQYVCSVWIKSSVLRKFRANVTYYNATGATGTSTGSKSGSYVDAAANTWTRLTIITDAIPAGTVSIRLDVSAASTAAGGTNFAISDTLRIDDYMVNEGTTLYAFFDGANNGGTWVGTVNASASTKELPV